MNRRDFLKTTGTTSLVAVCPPIIFSKNQSGHRKSNIILSYKDESPFGTFNFDLKNYNYDPKIVEGDLVSCIDKRIILFDKNSNFAGIVTKIDKDYIEVCLRFIAEAKVEKDSYSLVTCINYSKGKETGNWTFEKGTIYNFIGLVHGESKKSSYLEILFDVYMT